MAWPRLLAVALIFGGLGVWLVWELRQVAWLVLTLYDDVAIVLQMALLGLLGYCWFALRLGTIAWWAMRRTFASLGLLLPLATRALPLLLLFVTFLFINTEVWQVSALLDARTMWITILIFVTVAGLFLLARLPEELEGHAQVLEAADIRAACRDTPFAAIADCTSDDELDDDDDRVVGLERINLLLVLAIAQFVQVLLLSAIVLAFFLGFGAAIMHPEVVRAWLGDAAGLHPILGVERFSVELVKVAVFLASFSGLYFTVYAVSEAEYREQFFTEILQELRRAVSARAAYRVGRTGAAGVDEAGSVSTGRDDAGAGGAGE